MSDTHYIAIIGDMIGSRQIENRSDVQVQLGAVLQEINGLLSETIVSKFVITLGDEFQGLVTSEFPFREFWEVFDRSFGRRYPVRFGVGIGSLSTPLQESAIGMDGPCFHFAREAMTCLKSNKQQLAFRGFPNPLALNALCMSLFDICSGWNERQYDAVRLKQTLESQVEIASQLDITKQSVTDLLQAAKWEIYDTIWSGIDELLCGQVKMPD